MEITIKSIKYGEIKVLYDDEDHERIKEYTWHVNFKNNKFYIANVSGKEIQRIIMNTPKGKETDHINGNTLDNRKINLRICSHAENCQNRRKQKNNVSGLKGVSWHKACKKWQASIQHNRKQIHLGYFHDKELASISYNYACIQYHGEFACIKTS